jgi:hypothetical protein
MSSNQKLEIRKKILDLVKVYSDINFTDNNFIEGIINEFLYNHLCNKTNYDDTNVYDIISILNYVNLNDIDLDNLIVKKNFNYLLFNVLYVFNNKIYNKIIL